MFAAIAESAKTLQQVAISEGQDIAGAAIYGNYALADVPLSAIYGKNVPRLRKIKQKIGEPLLYRQFLFVVTYSFTRSEQCHGAGWRL